MSDLPNKLGGAAAPDAGEDAPQRIRLRWHLRTYFLAGLVVVGPIGITIYVTWWFVALFDAWFKPLVPAAYNPDNYLQFSVPGVGLLVALLLITSAGALAANLFGRSLIRIWERVLNRMPVVRSLYKTTKQIFETALSNSHASFREVGLIEFPKNGQWSIVFIARDVGGEIVEKTGGEPMVAAFVPTTPNPTSGYLLFLPKKDVIPLEMSIEDGAKLVISGGLVMPEGQSAPSLPPGGNGRAATPEAAAKALSARDKALSPPPRRPSRESANPLGYSQLMAPRLSTGDDST